MAIRTIFQEGEECLSKRCREVTVFDKILSDLIDDLFDTRHKADGAGLAAPQIGVVRRVAVVDVDGVKMELVNPQIIAAEGQQIGEEGCLSVDFSKNCEVLRPQTVTVRAYDRTGKMFERTVSDLPARCVCHELDHLEGILFYTREYKGKKK